VEQDPGDVAKVNNLDFILLPWEAESVFSREEQHMDSMLKGPL
jgi:hypothetical protein